MRRIAAAAAACALLAACGSTAGAPGHPAGSGDTDRATAAATAFLTTYVDPDGAVVRRDQGGDTVSEGQAYALLLAVAVSDRRRFATVWTWTQAHLQRPDGLFAYHWSGGRAVDQQAAADADEQTAWALDLAASRFGEPAYREQARRIAEAVAAREVAYDDAGRPLLAAGPWAVGRGGPATAEPGYWTYPADAALAALTGDGRWQALAAADEQHLVDLVGTGSSLPPDWVGVGGGTQPHPVAAPDGTAVGSGQDGLRALVWQSCSGHAAATGPGWWRLLSPTADAAPGRRSLDGAPLGTDSSPLGAVAAAAAAYDAGDRASGDRLLDRADAIAARYPTYYGAAWDALGRVLLTTRALADCGG